jgi:hypothetical protein
VGDEPIVRQSGRLKLTDGDAKKAAEYLDRARPLVKGAQFSDWTRRFERFQLELRLTQDKLRTAVNWADEMLQDDALEGRPDVDAAQLALSRVLIVKGDGPSLHRGQISRRNILNNLKRLEVDILSPEKSPINSCSLIDQTIYHGNFIISTEFGRLYCYSL